MSSNYNPQKSTLNLLSAFQPKERYVKSAFSNTSVSSTNLGSKKRGNKKVSVAPFDSSNGGGNGSKGGFAVYDALASMDNSQPICTEDLFKDDPPAVSATSRFNTTVRGGRGPLIPRASGMLPGLSLDGRDDNKRDPFEQGKDITVTKPKRAISNSRGKIRKMRLRNKTRIFDDPAVIAGYASVPMLAIDELPRGGISIETKACGRVQFGIPPETIKDSMRMGLDVPEFYIVPVERFCREMGPALGINLAEFEFPAYFNYFVRQRKVTLIVDSEDAEKNIRSVFSETLLGPSQFRDHDFPKPHEPEDFDPTFPEEKRPNFYREFYHFRTAEKSTNYQEFTVDTLISFIHFQQNHNADDDDEQPLKLGEPPTIEEEVYDDHVKDYKSDDDFSAIMFDKIVRIAGDDEKKSAAGMTLKEKAMSFRQNKSSNNTATTASTTTTPHPHISFKDDVINNEYNIDHNRLTVMDDNARTTPIRRSSATNLGALSLAGLDDLPGNVNKSQMGPRSVGPRTGSFMRRGSHPSSGLRRLSIGGTTRRLSATSVSSRRGSDHGSSRRGSVETGGRRGSVETGGRRGSVETAGSSRRGSVEGSRRGSVEHTSYRRRGSTSNRSASNRRGSVENSSVHSSAHSSYDHSFGDTSSMVGEDNPERTSWMYSQVKWLGEVSFVYPPNTTEEQKKSGKTARVEVFKMPGGTEYIIHDIDENNVIIGKCRFSGTVRVPDEYAVEGFLAPDVEPSVGAALYKSVDLSRKNGMDSSDDFSGSVSDDSDDSDDENSFHGGSDEREGKRDRSGRSADPLIPMAIVPPTFHPPSFGVTVLGNSHGFDKNGSTSGYVLWVNGRGVMVDPPPYSSATLEREGIRPQMIMACIITHCHADHDAGAFQKVLTGSKVAVITTPTIYKSFIRKYAALSGLSPALLRHSHRHRPAIIGQALKFQGAKFHFRYTLHTIPCIAFKVEWRGKSMVFTGDHLNSPPMIQQLQDKGVLTKERADHLRELPLIPCDALLHEAGAPPIHTPLSVLQELPEEVKARLYVVHTSALPPDSGLRVAPTGTGGTIRLDGTDIASNLPKQIAIDDSCHNASVMLPMSASTNTLHKVSSNSMLLGLDKGSIDGKTGYPNQYISDFFRNPSNAGDFNPNASTLYGASMLGCSNHGANKFNMQKDMPLVFLRPTCVSDAWFILNLLSNIPFFSSLSYVYTMEVLEIAMVELYCVNEVVVPAAKRLETLCVVWEGTCIDRSVSEPSTSKPGAFDYGAEPDDVSHLGYESDDDSLEAKFNSAVWHAGDWTGPVSLQPDVDRSAESSTEENPKDVVALSAEGVKVIMLQMKDLHRILKRGSKLFRKYLTIQEKQMEQEAAMKAQISIRNPDGGLSLFDGIRAEDEESRGAGQDTLLEVIKYNSALGRLTALQKRHLESIAEGPRLFQEGAFLWKVGESVDYAFLIITGNAAFGHTGKNLDDDELSRGGYFMGRAEEDKLLTVQPNSEYAKLELALQVRMDRIERNIYDHPRDLLPKEEAQLLARDRFANKVLARLYARRAYTAGVIFSRGHFLSDISRMVSGDLSGGGSTLPGEGGFHRGHCHSSNMVAGRGGCVVMIFQRSSFVPFLESNPGVLLTLLGTHVVV